VLQTNSLRSGAESSQGDNPKFLLWLDDVVLLLVGFGAGGCTALLAEVFVEVSRRQHQE